MALKGIEYLGLILVLMTMFCHGTKAQSGCTSVLMGLAPCLNYITGKSSTPSSSCCSKLSNVVQSKPECLCSVLNGGGSSFGITINQTQAVALPGACNVQTPPISKCNAATGPAISPASSPMSSPADSSDDTPDTTIITPSSSMPTIPSGSGTGSKTISGSITNGSNIVVVPFHLNVFIFFLISCFSSIAIKL